MNHPETPFNLTELYKRAIKMTHNAYELLLDEKKDEAIELLHQRSLLVEEIQREIVQSPLWGEDIQLDQAALLYIKADQRLEQFFA